MGCRNKRDRGSRRGKGALEMEGEGEERGSLKSKLAPSPLPHAVLYVMLIHTGNVSRCPGLVLVELPSPTG